MIFLTGATGLVGSHIARQLIREGFELKALCRDLEQLGLAEDLKSKINWQVGDILDIPSLEACIDAGDMVIHCAAVVSFNPRDKSEMQQINVEGTKNVANTCLDKGVKRLLHISSVAAIGRNKQLTEINEENRWEESKLNTYYAFTKHLAEMEVWRAYAEGLPVVILNPSVVLGQGDWNKSSSRLFRYVWEEKPFYTKGSVNYIDARDIADICLQILNTDEINGERFILNAGNIDYQSFFTKVAQHLGKKPPRYAVTPIMAQIAWRAFALSSFFTGKVPLVTRETARVSQKSFHYQNNKIKKQLNFEFRKLNDTLSWICEDIKEKQKIQ